MLTDLHKTWGTCIEENVVFFFLLFFSQGEIKCLKTWPKEPYTRALFPWFCDKVSPPVWFLLSTRVRKSSGVDLMHLRRLRIPVNVSLLLHLRRVISIYLHGLSAPPHSSSSAAPISAPGTPKWRSSSPLHGSFFLAFVSRKLCTGLQGDSEEETIELPVKTD